MAKLITLKKTLLVIVLTVSLMVLAGCASATLTPLPTASTPPPATETSMPPTDTVATPTETTAPPTEDVPTLVPIDVQAAQVDRINNPDAPPQQVEAFTRGQQTFAFDFYQTFDEGTNLIFSPYSIARAFSMAYAGARGETEAEMVEVFNYLPQDVHHPAFNLVDQAINNQQPTEEAIREDEIPFELNTANSAWQQAEFPIQEAYLETLALHYGAAIFTVDFEGDPGTALEQINGWVEEETEGRIEDIVSEEQVNANTRLVLADAVYFSGRWLYPFGDGATFEAEFTLLDGTISTADLMSMRADLAYTEGDGYQAVRLPYANSTTDMLVIVPDEGRFTQVEAQLSPEFLAGLDMSPRDVFLYMPRWEFETEADLKVMLPSLGLTAPFGPGANFEGIAPGLFITDAVHKANITVDEEGTKAGAATVIWIALSGGGVDLFIDRPFIFLIQERETGTILFMGRVVNPTE